MEIEKDKRIVDIIDIEEKNVTEIEGDANSTNQIQIETPAGIDKDQADGPNLNNSKKAKKRIATLLPSKKRKRDDTDDAGEKNTKIQKVQKSDTPISRFISKVKPNFFR